MRDDDVVLDRRALLLHLGEVEGGVPVADRLLQRVGDVVDGAQVRRANARIGGDRPSYAAYMLAKHVSPPTSGSLHRAQDRRHRRVGEERVVAVPLVGALAPRVHLVEHDDLGRVLVHRLQRRDVHRSEAQRERELLLVGDVLVAEEEDEVVEETPGAASSTSTSTQLLPQVDAVHLGPDGRGQRRDLDVRHGSPLAPWLAGGRRDDPG